LVQSYVRGLKNAVIAGIERQWPTESETLETSSGAHRRSTLFARKGRKSSIRPAKEIGSERADVILRKLENGSFKLVAKSDSLDGKKSLAYLVWALGHAELADVTEGVSVHDVSALLYRACKIDLYPINISRVVYGNPVLVRQVGQEKRTKKYLLTKDGKAIFTAKFL
ncbi:MAG TPA: hypothetical protein VEL47_03275, partial [Myxococcota bacterium]|nr:hypothetical protein [Myxococcota bacterium]